MIRRLSAFLQGRRALEERGSWAGDTRIEETWELFWRDGHPMATASLRIDHALEARALRMREQLGAGCR